METAEIHRGGGHSERKRECEQWIQIQKWNETKCVGFILEFKGRCARQLKGADIGEEVGM